VIEPEDGFHQIGMPDEPIVYWLDLQAAPEESGTLFGWKTSFDHWNDDAVWAIGAEPYSGIWEELRYPPGHPFFPASIDLAFGIRTTYGTGVPEEEAAPEGARLYQNVPNPFNATRDVARSGRSGARTPVRRLLLSFERRRP